MKGTSLCLVCQQDWTSKQRPSLAEYNLHISNERVHGTGQRFSHGSPTFLWQNATSLLWAGARATRAKITISGIPKCQNYCVIFIVYTQFTHTARGPRAGYPWINPLKSEKVKLPPNTILSHFRKSIAFLGSSQASPICPFRKSHM